MNSHSSLTRPALYHQLAIVQKGRLVQFAGSPLGKKFENPLDILNK